MQVLSNLSQVVTLEKAAEKGGRHLQPEDLSIIENGAVVHDGEEILWVGKTEELPEKYVSAPTLRLEGHVLTPEVVDSHTHIVFGGNRAHEYTMRLNGADYQDIAKAGGGILSTMRSTQEEDQLTLFEKASARIERLHSYGIGTIEIKSGYGLTWEKEKELNHIIHRLKKKFAPKIRIVNTYMAAHAVPKEYSSSSEFMDAVVLPLLEELAGEGIIDQADIFHEEGYFSTEDARRLYEKCRELGLPFKSHADEFQDSKAAVLAAEMEALSCDHLLRTEQDGIEKLAASNTVATLLPGTGLFLGKPQANARKFLDAGCKVALASDYNPGSCHLDNVILAASIAAPIYKMNLAEIWTGLTLNAGHALGLNQQGVLKPEMEARFSLFKVDMIDEITYSWGRNFARDLHQLSS